MKKILGYIVLYIFTLFMFKGCTDNPLNDCDIIVIGGGASGVMAAIQAARLDKKVLIVEETEWFGGMFTAAGVSAIDGNYTLASGLWEEFRQLITNYYGGPDKVKTGWVSNVMFEPDIAAAILDSLVAREKGIQVRKKAVLERAIYEKGRWKVSIRNDVGTFEARGRILIDATELGDVVGMLDISNDIGMDSRNDTGEGIAPEQANNIIQDLTYVAILEKVEEPDPPALIEPEGYDPSLFRCTCEGFCNQDSIQRTLWPCDQMMEYGKLPNEKIMINWPIFGNDYYINAIESTREERIQVFEKAKNFTRCYVYYLQKELGYDEWRISRDIFPTEDGFPMIPYHRESRRVRGIVRFDVNDLVEPYDQENYLYKTGIAVGDYPVDHHHAAYPKAEKLPDLHFYPVPSYTLPLGALIPKESEHLIVAEKSISVTNIVNGTTRLQPVCMLIGQAAGTLAAMAVKLNVPVNKVPVRTVQKTLLLSKAYVLPYSDVDVDDPAWEVVQKIGATGLLKGEGKNIGWRNYTFFHPDSVVSKAEIIENLKEIGIPVRHEKSITDPLTINALMRILESVNIPSKHTPYGIDDLQSLWNKIGWDNFDLDRPLIRKEVAVLIDHILNPFDWPIDHQGRIIDY